MARGSKPGERRGGRQKGTPNQATRVSRKIAEDALALGITPLEVMLSTMREHYAAGRKDQAAGIAKDAAPYVHPRLSAIEQTGKGGGPIEFREVSDLDRVRALKVFLAKAGA